MLKRFLMVFAMASLMAGCSSGVKLNKAPVENQNAGSMSTQGAQSAVAPVAVNESTIEGKGPAGSHSVYFDFDKYVVKPEYQNVIENNANYLKADPRRHAVVEGNTDDRGSAESTWRSASGVPRRWSARWNCSASRRASSRPSATARKSRRRRAPVKKRAPRTAAPTSPSEKPHTGAA